MVLYTAWLADEFLEARSGPYDGLVSLRSGGDATRFYSGPLLQERQVVFGTHREILVARNPESRRFPARQAFIDRLDPFHFRNGSRHAGNVATIQFVSGANADLVE